MLLGCLQLVDMLTELQEHSLGPEQGFLILEE
jgi:hypothetical protein